MRFIGRKISLYHVPLLRRVAFSTRHANWTAGPCWEHEQHCCTAPIKAPGGLCKQTEASGGRCKLSQATASKPPGSVAAAGFNIPARIMAGQRKRMARAQAGVTDRPGANAHALPLQERPCANQQVLRYMGLSHGSVPFDTRRACIARVGYRARQAGRHQVQAGSSQKAGRGSLDRLAQGRRWEGVIRRRWVRMPARRQQSCKKAVWQGTTEGAWKGARGRPELTTQAQVESLGVG